MGKSGCFPRGIKPSAYLGLDELMLLLPGFEPTTSRFRVQLSSPLDQGHLAQSAGLAWWLRRSAGKRKDSGSTPLYGSPFSSKIVIYMDIVS